MDDSYIYAIVALLPLAAGMVVFQANPYHALVLRGVLGAIAALVYAVLGAADVALTEALVGTMLAITLYAIAVRSSLVMRLGVVEGDAPPDDPTFQKILTALRLALERYHLRLELIAYSDRKALERALAECKIHGTCTGEATPPSDRVRTISYHTLVRIPRLYEILREDMAATATTLACINPAQIPDSK